MAGHSKWANIKHRKAAQDAKRGKVFTKIIRELVVAAIKPLHVVLAVLMVKTMMKKPMKVMAPVVLLYWLNA